MTKVVIVSRTRMGQSRCIGALERETLRSIRLCPREGEHAWPDFTPFRIGDVWDLSYHDATLIEAPHFEDVIIDRVPRERTGPQTGLGTFIGTHVGAWMGGPKDLFGGALRFTSAGKGYLPPNGGLEQSVGFWRPDVELVHDDRRYVFQSDGSMATISYVGEDVASEVIPAGALVRVSLSRPFAPDGGQPVCWLQVSGWYPPG